MPGTRRLTIGITPVDLTAAVPMTDYQEYEFRIADPNDTVMVWLVELPAAPTPGSDNGIRLRSGQTERFKGSAPAHLGGVNLYAWTNTGQASIIVRDIR